MSSSLVDDQCTLKVKVSRDNDTRLWRYSTPINFEELCDFVRATWDQQKVLIQTEDEEGDLITIASTEDLQEVMDFAVVNKQRSLKLSVQNVGPFKNDEKPNQSECPENKNQEEKEAPKHEFGSVHAMAFDFLSNPKIVALLPELCTVLVSKIVDKDSALSSEDIAAMIVSELNEEPFTEIASHPLYVSYGALAVPLIAGRIAKMQTLCEHFRAETIKTWVGQIISTLQRVMQRPAGSGPCPFQDFVVDLEFPERTDTGKAIHYGVECDLCAEHPIIGDRFKCTVCPNWDCCARCEPQHDHPLLKLKQAMKKYADANLEWSGMREVLSGQCLQNNVFGCRRRNECRRNRRRGRRGHCRRGKCPMSSKYDKDVPESNESDLQSKVEQVKQIMNLGSEVNDEMVKELLVKHGDISKVLNLLLQ